MSEVSPQRHQERARSFGDVAEAYDRARPSYPRDAVDWLVGPVGPGPVRVLDVGAGTGKLTEVLHGAGHEVLAVEPLAPMLQQLARRVPAPHVQARAEELPVPSRSVDVVLCGQAFHWFDADVALREFARVLRPGGVIGLVWNSFDDSVPWVRRLHRLLNPDDPRSAASADPLMHTPHFGFVEQRSFRTWHHHTKRTLADLTRSHSRVSVRPEHEVERVVEQVSALYDDYGRGPDGMRLPYVAECFQAFVRHQEEAPPVPEARPQDPDPGGDETGDETGVSEDGTEHTGPVTPTGERRPPEDPGLQLIDFR